VRALNDLYGTTYDKPLGAGRLPSPENSYVQAGDVLIGVELKRFF
jgi:hypothetical protein